MIHGIVMIMSVSLRPAIGWLRKKRDIQVTPHRKRLLAVAAFRACGKWLLTCVILHILIVLALVRGISSGGGVFAPELDKWQLALLRKIPARVLTRMLGRITLIHLIPLVRWPILGLFCVLFGIKLDDTKRQTLRQFSSLRDFFTRTLREDIRPISHNHSLVSPADGIVMHVGHIVDGEVTQVKGVNYKLSDFLGGPPSPDVLSDKIASDDNGYRENNQGLPRNDSLTNLFQSFPHLKPSRDNDLYHAVVYLTVADYHHFHSPANWNVLMRRHIVGELLSVAPWVVKQVPNLFTLNERVLFGGYWEHGFFSITAVGAFNVGSIEIDMDEELVTNSEKDEDERGKAYHGQCCLFSNSAFFLAASAVLSLD